MLVDETRAKNIATKFLEQYHSNVSLKSITFEDNAYMIILDTGLTEKKTMHVRVDANDAHIIGFGYPTDFEKIARVVLELGNEIRYVLIVDSKGDFVHSATSPNKTVLIKQEDQITNLSTDLHILRQLLKIFDESLGKTTFIHFEREKIHILIFYVRNIIFCITCERSMDSLRLVEISNKIRFTIQRYIDRMQ